MSYFEMPPRTGMGSAALATVISSAIGPIAKAGTDVYATHEDTRIAKKELRQREAEFQRLYELSQKQLQAQERQQIIAQQAAAQRSAVWGYWISRNMPYLVGGIALLALAFAASKTLGEK